ncbi:hypothetical protein J4Q44_G00055790 [Coregonus suidteri]|uniref:Ig-like domain-containing protein n=1 Tax=Coregonus suidteri TaxID=861788 RepID=A0AAN8R082_9TELE
MLCFYPLDTKGFTINCLLWCRGTLWSPLPLFSMRSLTEVETRLPCRFKVHLDQGESRWYQGPDDHSFTTLPDTQSLTRAGTTVTSAPFPSGNFERQLSLTVWTTPISSLDPVVLVEGQSYRLAASCRSVARPPPQPLLGHGPDGQFTEQELGGITNNLVVHYPPNAEISGFDQNWYAGLEGAVLSCVSGGNPKPQSFTWTKTRTELAKNVLQFSAPSDLNKLQKVLKIQELIRLNELKARKGGDLPEGVTARNGSLLFNRPLSLTDAGIYQCVANNVVGVGKAEVEITVTELPQNPALFNSLLMIIVGGKLEKELTVKKEEISTLSRQASFRRVNSVSTDARGQFFQMEENIPLRVEGTLRASLSSLGEQGHIRDSRSTLVGGGGLDYLGRPVLNNSSRRGRESRATDREENRLRVESYVRNSTMSLETRLHPPIQPSPFPMEQSTKLLRSLNGSAIIPTEGGLHVRHSPLSCSYPPVTDEEEEGESVEGERGTSPRMSLIDQGRSEDQDNSSQISDAERGLNHHFQQNNGTLRPKPRPNGIPLTPSPHASLIHKAQIV